MRSKRQNKSLCFLRDKGIISIFILASLSFLVFMVISFATRITYESRMVFSTKDRTQAAFISRDAVEYLKKVLRDDDEKIDTVSDPWNIVSPKEYKIEEGKWKIERGYDEERLINVNESGVEILDRIFGNYPEYILCLLDWLDADDIPATIPGNPKYRGLQGAEKDDPFYLEEGYAPRNGKMRSLMELLMIKGGTAFLPTPALPPASRNFFVKEAYASHAWDNSPPDWDRDWRHIKPPKRVPGRHPKVPPGKPPKLPKIPIANPSPRGTGLTVYGDGKNNLNTAGGSVLMALGFQRETARRILAYRLYGGVFKRIDTEYIIKELINKGVLLVNEAEFLNIVGNIRKIVAKGKLKVNSEYFRFQITSLTKNGSAHKAVVVLKRQAESIEGKIVKKVKIVTWWEDYW